KNSERPRGHSPVPIRVTVSAPSRRTHTPGGPAPAATTSTVAPARARRTASSSTKQPAKSPAWRGYDVLRTPTTTSDPDRRRPRSGLPDRGGGGELCSPEPVAGGSGNPSRVPE